MHPALHVHPEVDHHRGHEARVEQDVPGEDRREVVVRHGHDEPVRTPEIEHEHREPAREQRDREHPGEPRERLVGGSAEHRRERCDVERAGCGHDQEHREHVGQSPHDSVVHARDVMSLDVHVVCGEDACEGDEREQHDEHEVAGAPSFELAVCSVAHRRRHPPAHGSCPLTPNSHRFPAADADRGEMGADFSDRADSRMRRAHCRPAGIQQL